MHQLLVFIGIMRNNGKKHTGIDIISTSGDKNIKATHGGIVRIVAFDEDGYGNYISVEQYDGFRSLYCHLAEVYVVPWQMINMGEVIGIEGETGNATGIHLHYEVRKYPYNLASCVDSSKYLLIKTEKGPIKYLELSYEEQKELIRQRAKLEDDTMHMGTSIVCA